jgi:hypothetical protein
MWQTEDQFVNDVADLLPSAAGATKRLPILWKEYRTGYGRPDVLLLDACPNVLAKRAALIQQPPPLSHIAALTMAFLLHRRWTSLDTVAGHLRVSPVVAGAVASQLEQRELVLRRSGCIRARPLQECMAVREVIAFEAKLRGWQSAVTQARRHLWFAQASYVLLANTETKVVSRAAAFCLNTGVGLMVPDNEGSPIVVVRSTPTPSHPTYFAWVLNERLVDSYASTRPN